MTYPTPKATLRNSMALGAAAWFTASSDGQVVVSSFSPIVIGPDASPFFTSQDDSTQYLRFDTGTGLMSTVVDRPAFPAFSFRIADGGKFGKYVSAGLGSWNGSYGVTSTPLTAGTNIGAGSVWGFSFNMPTGESNLSNVYRGIRLDVGSGNYRYGYVTYSTGPDLGGAGPSTITITGAGFETSLNTPIAAGAIPEPASVAALAGLAAGAVALKRLRRKKQAA